MGYCLLSDLTIILKPSPFLIFIFKTHTTNPAKKLVNIDNDVYLRIVCSGPCSQSVLYIRVSRKWRKAGEKSINMFGR